jgi:very-short-patch-repair endonuclease
VAARQHGVITSSQLGLSKAGIASWVRTGLLHRLYRGVYAYGHPRLSNEGRWMAGVLAGGEGAALAGDCAAVLLALGKRVPRDVEIVVPRRRRPQAGLRIVSCTRDPRDVTVVNGIPVTIVARLLVDLSDSRDAYELANVMHEAAYLGKFDLHATRAALARANGRRNVKVVKRAIELHLSGSAGSRSRLENRFRRLIAGLPQPRHNVNVCGFEVDFAWPHLVVEIDGPHHNRARSKADDRVKQAALQAAGYTVLRFTERDVDERPAEVLDALLRATRNAGPGGEL